jgi:hypothetical protein
VSKGFVVNGEIIGAGTYHGFGTCSLTGVGVKGARVGEQRDVGVGVSEIRLLVLNGDMLNDWKVSSWRKR